MLFTKKNEDLYDVAETKKEKLARFGHKVEKFVDNNPLTATLIACGTVHIAGYTLLHYVTKPPSKTEPETATCNPYVS